MTSMLQPMDAGIIRLLKAHYRLVRHCLRTLEEQGKPLLPNLREAITMIGRAWAIVSKETIANCYNHVYIIGEQRKKIIVEEFNNFETDLIDWREKLAKFKFVPKDSIKLLSLEEYINIEHEESTGETLTFKDIIRLVKEEDEEDVQEELKENKQEEEEELNVVSNAQALASINTLEIYFMQYENMKNFNINFLYQIKNQIEELRENNKKQLTLNDFLVNKHN